MFFSLIAAPALFDELGQERAGDAVNVVFPKYYAFGVADGGRGFLPAAGTVGLGFGGVTPLGARIVALAPLVLQAFDRRAGGVGAALHAVVDSFEFADVPVERLDGGVEGVHAGGEFADSLVEGVESLVDGSRVREVRNWRLAVGQRALHGSQPLVGVVVGHASGWFRSGT
uniref:hypothetical protein n=1 Tax=Halobacterium bonnevillei TaxID=2692200 RepID=UPI002D7FAE32|nr:hypothetical protein [Halobacterium bonnevillei]